VKSTLIIDNKNIIEIVQEEEDFIGIIKHFKKCLYALGYPSELINKYCLVTLQEEQENSFKQKTPQYTPLGDTHETRRTRELDS
jgi:hypothetical protein